ncbi:hypothetical protein QWY82_00975 [Simiduia curdlanivorans]|uniref:Uncharacterized protein n=1 Tax=Simiduia curdlanivorans TaxID=1492769 RepID=A0ABV8V485_9GAMM|nr:hypothetical protein [Simiduia curdlanivorans]MDN3637367.1 hypothetical protein [Simiduia curdlanivorans]
MNNVKLFKSLCLVSLVAASTACASDKEELIAASAQYCAFYDSKTWGDSDDTYEIYNLIATKQQNEISNAEFKDLMATTDISSFASFYASVREKIERATGKPWDCDDFDHFYMPSQKLISISLNGLNQRRVDPNAENVIVISVSHAGDILIAGAPLSTTDLNDITKGVQARIAGRDIDSLDFVIYFDEGSRGEMIPLIFTALTNLDVQNISLIDY